MKLKQFNIDDQRIVTGLDIGFKTARCIMGQMDQNGSFDILAYSEIPHNGIHNQQIVNAKDVQQAIQNACQEVEVLSERQITDLWISLSCPFEIFSSEGMALITGGQVTHRHIQQSMATALAVPLPNHQEVVHVLPIDFRVDRKDCIYNPVGLSGLRLETSVLLVTCDSTTIQDLQRCVSNTSRFVRGFVIQPFSAGLSVCTTEDKIRGACVINMDSSGYQVSIFSNGRCIYLSQFNSSDLIGNLATDLRISTKMAQELVNKQGILFKNIPLADEEISSVPHELYQEKLIQNLEKSFQPIKEHLEEKGFSNLIQNGIILTGEESNLKNLDEWGKFYFEKPVRHGYLQGLSKNLGSFREDIKYSTSLGLLYYAHKDKWLDFKEPNKTSSFNIKYWFRDFIS